MLARSLSYEGCQRLYIPVALTFIKVLFKLLALFRVANPLLKATGHVQALVADLTSEPLKAV